MLLSYYLQSIYLPTYWSCPADIWRSVKLSKSKPALSIFAPNLAFLSLFFLLVGDTVSFQSSDPVPHPESQYINQVISLIVPSPPEDEGGGGQE